MTNDERDDLLIELKIKLENMGGRVDDIAHVLLEGNGKPAMTIRMALAEQDLERLKEERNDKKMPRSAWVAILISSVIGIAGFLTSVI